jgi:hypothetical protein
MDPTQQSVAPILFGAGKWIGSPLEFDLNATYDHLMTCVVWGIPESAGNGYVAISDPDGRALWARSVGPGWSAQPYDGVDRLEMLVQQASYIQIDSDVENLTISVSGWRVAPSIATITS